MISVPTVLLAFTYNISEEQLVRVSYISTVDNLERDFFLYLPKGYNENPERQWPVILFLHGDGERGNGKDELDYVLTHGPLYEAWIQKRDLPFIIISPQLHMFGRDTLGIDFLTNRDPNKIPKRLKEGVSEREPDFVTDYPMEGTTPFEDFTDELPKSKDGWNRVEDDLLSILNIVTTKYNADKNRIYLSGLSYGGFGTWYMASKHPELFAAINPIVGWGHPSLMEPIAKYKIPVWTFAGGRDNGDEKVEYFLKGLNKLEELGDPEVLFTIHEDMGHDTWKRVYAGEDIYNWFLKHSK
ncbi:MAG: peptidase [Ignavibacteria bacterium GWB2_36_8]|nr:MAG: peptidase [Ignavibacteria bacterium GWB2_36_8]OGU51005.1 MAG: peptidase [Ignavibacteria bacterium GWC2_36_12]